MANISAASILYSTPLVAKVGDLLLTATNVETASSATEYVTGGVELNVTKLGLTDEAISGAQSVAREASIGTLTATTMLPALIWCNPWMLDSKTSGEGSEKELKAAGNFGAIVTLEGKVPFLRLIALTTAGQDKGFSELKVKTAVSQCFTTVYALGK